MHPSENSAPIVTALAPAQFRLRLRLRFRSRSWFRGCLMRVLRSCQNINQIRFPPLLHCAPPRTRPPPATSMLHTHSKYMIFTLSYSPLLCAAQRNIRTLYSRGGFWVSVHLSLRAIYLFHHLTVDCFPYQTTEYPVHTFYAGLPHRLKPRTELARCSVVRSLEQPLNDTFFGVVSGPCRPRSTHRLVCHTTAVFIAFEDVTDFYTIRTEDCLQTLIVPCQLPWSIHVCYSTIYSGPR